MGGEKEVLKKEKKREGQPFFRGKKISFPSAEFPFNATPARKGKETSHNGKGEGNVEVKVAPMNLDLRPIHQEEKEAKPCFWEKKKGHTVAQIKKKPIRKKSAVGRKCRLSG